MIVSENRLDVECYLSLQPIVNDFFNNDEDNIRILDANGWKYEYKTENTDKSSPFSNITYERSSTQMSDLLNLAKTICQKENGVRFRLFE